MEIFFVIKVFGWCNPKLVFKALNFITYLDSYSIADQKIKREVRWDEFFDWERRDMKESLRKEFLDGRNRYIACLMVNVVPEFEHLPEDTDAKKYVFTMNFYRRHFTKAERARLGIEFLKEEREKAAERKKATQFKNKTGKKPTKSSVRTNLVHTVKPEKKGRAIKLAAEMVDLDANTLREYEKITIIAKDNEEIKKDLEYVDLGLKTIHSVYQKINGYSKPPKEKLNRVKECEEFRAAPCPYCMAQIIACKSDLKSGNLILKKECPDPCIDSSIEV